MMLQRPFSVHTHPMHRKTYIIPTPSDLLGFFGPIIPVRRPGWEWVDCAGGAA